MGDDTFWGLSTTDWTAIMAMLTAGLLVTAVAAAFYAGRQVRLGRQQAEDSRKAQTEASRPYVIVTLESAATGPPLFDLVAKNIGQRPAVEVSVILDPPPLRASEPPGYELAKLKMLNQPVAVIAPGQELRTHYDSHGERQGRDDLPSSHRVTLRYRDTSGHEYVESAVLDIDALQGTLYGDVKTVHHVGKSLAEIAKTLKGASVLGRAGRVDVDAAVEPRADRDNRLAAERDERMRRLRASAAARPDLAAALSPTASDGTEAGWLARVRESLSRTVRQVAASLKRIK